MATEKEALDALNQYDDQISNMSNVVGLGVVQIHEESGLPENDMGVAVYVQKKLPEAQVAKDQLIPRVLELKGKGKKVKIRTKVIEQGVISLEDELSPERL